MNQTIQYRTAEQVSSDNIGMFFCTFSSKKYVLGSRDNDVQKAVLNDSARCSFTGKEKDSETGYYYFGARYYNPDLSLWLSVDPMADKYPSLSPYNYCAWNPMKIVDPDGAEMDDYQIDKWGKISKCKDQSHAVEGRDRLISKKYGGKVKYDESGNPLNAYVEAAKGTFGSYDHDAKRGMKVTPKEYEDNLGLKHQHCCPLKINKSSLK